MIPKRKTEESGTPAVSCFAPSPVKRMMGLPRRRDWYRNLFETAPDCIYAISAEGKTIELLNPAFERLTGWSCSEWVGKPFDRLVHRDDLAVALKAFRQLLCGESPPPLELRILTRSGQYLIANATGSPYIENGKVVGISGYVRNITERKKVEEELRKREMQLGEVQEIAHIGSWEVEISTNRMTWSDELCRIYGLNTHEGEITCEDFFQRVCPDDRGFVQKVFIKAFRDHKPFSFDYRIVQPDGTRRTLYTRGAFVADPTGESGRVIGIALDITERRRIEQALLESEKRYRELFENIPIGIYRTTPDGRILMTNPALVQMLGYASFDELALHNLDRERAEPTYSRSEFKNTLEEKGEIKGLEAEWVRRDGRVVFMRENAKAIRGEDGTVSYYEGTVEDITENKLAEEARRTSEERFSKAFNASPHSMSISTLEEARFVDINDTFLSITGYTRDEVIGRTAFELGLWPEAEFRAKALKVINRRAAVRDLETWVRTKAGEVRTALLSLEIIKLGDRQYLLVAANDITERKLAEEQLKSSREQLRALSVHLQSVREEERISLAREVHDEMGRALTSLKLDLSWIDSRLSDEQLKDKIASMSKMVDTAVQTVRRISGELRPPVLDDFGLTAALEWDIQEFRNRTGINCEFTSDPEDIALDPNLSTAIFRIFQEAMTNVARHANASNVKVSLKQAQSHLRLRIKDTGRGIRKSEISNPRSLGLIGIRERVLPWGGTVNISGVPGKGTDVTVEIPIRRRSDKTRAKHMRFKKEISRRNSDRS